MLSADERSGKLSADGDGDFVFEEQQDLEARRSANLAHSSSNLPEAAELERHGNLAPRQTYSQPSPIA